MAPGSDEDLLDLKISESERKRLFRTMEKIATSDEAITADYLRTLALAACFGIENRLNG